MILIKYLTKLVDFFSAFSDPILLKRRAREKGQRHKGSCTCLYHKSLNLTGSTIEYGEVEASNTINDMYFITALGLKHAVNSL